jgi:LemA protein
MDTQFAPINPSLIPIAVIAGFVLLVLIWLFATYNKLVNLRNTIDESWSDVDTELKRRHDLIPNLVETVKGYAAHEREVLEAVAEARSRAVSSLEGKAHSPEEENQLVQSLRQLFAVAEGYPDLKADHNFLQLQQELVNTEDRIQAARRFYNGNIREYNTLVQAFPSTIVASFGGFSTRPCFEIEDLVERAVVSVAFPQKP